VAAIWIMLREPWASWVACGDGAIDLEMTEHAPDTIGQFVEGAVLDDRLFAV
jgi:hypothetical protein